MQMKSRVDLKVSESSPQWWTELALKNRHEYREWSNHATVWEKSIPDNTPRAVGWCRKLLGCIWENEGKTGCLKQHAQQADG